MSRITVTLAIFVIVGVVINIHTVSASASCYACHDGGFIEGLPNDIYQSVSCNPLDPGKQRPCVTDICYKFEQIVVADGKVTSTARACGVSHEICKKNYNFQSDDGRIQVKCKSCSGDGCNSGTSLAPTAFFITLTSLIGYIYLRF